MASYITHMQKLEDAIDRGAREGFDEHTLWEVDFESRMLQEVDMPGGRPGLNALRSNQMLVIDSINLCRATGEDVYLCDLRHVDGELPTIEDLKSDPELAIIWSFLDMQSSVHPEIAVRDCRAGAPEPEPGDKIEIDPALDTVFKTACLVVRTGRP